MTAEGCACQETLRLVREIASRHRGELGPLMPTLAEVQRQVKYLSRPVLAEIAAQLDIPLSKVYATASFYTLYNTKQKGKNIIRVCASAPCHIGGAEDIVSELERLLGIKVGATTADGVFTLEEASCLGVCGVAPAMMVNEEVYGNLRSQDLPRILSEWRLRAEKEA